MQINPDHCCECTSFRWWIGSSRANSAQSYNYPFRVFPFHAQVISHAGIVVSNKDIISHKSQLHVRRNYINTQSVFMSCLFLHCMTQFRAAVISLV